MRIVEQYLRQLNTKKLRFRHSVVILSVLSLLVMLAVCWNLRQTGIAIANDACCGYEEHVHTDECPKGDVLICGYDTEETSVPSSEATETSAPSSEATETSEEATEPSTEEIAIISEDEPTETTVEASTEPSVDVPDETAETALDVVLDIAADVIAEIIPVAQAAEIPEESEAGENGEAHVHTAECYEIGWLCGYEEHIHTLDCYSDTTADLEDWNTWADSIPQLTGRISEDIVLVAQSQLGIKESETNYALGADGTTQNGITRYGQWYGNPYGAWSNMFTSFCIRFAGGSDLPINSGAEKMKMDWDALNLYRHAGGYEPLAGDIIFFDKNQNGTPESTGVVVRYFDFILTVIEGDVDNAVVQREYRIDDPMVFGYGMVNYANRIPMMAAGDDLGNPIAMTVDYTGNAILTNNAQFILYAIGADGKPYAMDASGNAVPITIEDGFVFSNSSSLLWTVNRNNNNNIGLYNGSNYLNPTQTALVQNSNKRQDLNFTASGTGVKIRKTGNNNNYYVQLGANQFTTVNGSANATTLYLAQTPTQVTLWLDGTNGGLMSYNTSWNRTYTNWNNQVQATYTGEAYVLPDTWQSPATYQYKLAGWVNIKTGDYYEPGDTIRLKENTVLYADWVAETYDIGQNNDHVVNTSSTNNFITTHLFDYNALINLMSTKATVTVDANSHSENWAHVTNGEATYAGQTTLDFSFVDDDWEDNNYNNKLDDPSGRSERNQWTGDDPGHAYTNILGSRGTYVENNRIVKNLFDTTTSVVGKHYLGTGDYLFQYDQATGYYYYDANKNAAAYNKSQQRFYVYDYLERSSDSPGDDPDFLPLNSPYANKANYVREVGSNYEYVARTVTAEGNGNNARYATRAEWLYGMRTDISFGLPDDVGTTNGNRDINGNEMHFKFKGDDDVWILVDGKLVLDLGGIHLAVSGDINFSTGVVTAYKHDGTLDYTYKIQELFTGDNAIKAGEHTLSILYLERGASMANCAIEFNLAPRFAIELRKEDVLTQNALDGAQFAFYTDPSCSEESKCSLWPSYESYMNGDDPSNVFTAHFGTAFVWGLRPSTTYYIKEVRSPNGTNYSTTSGIIKVTLSKTGLNSYGATILPDAEGNITNGFSVHGFSVDEEAQIFYLHITNAQNWVEHTTSVYVEKEWGDTKNHDAEAVTVYLNVTDPDGTVRRIRQIDLCKENDWKYTWSNLPMYQQIPGSNKEDTNAPYTYSVEEVYVSGYEQVIRPLQSTSSGEGWGESTKFENGGVYLLKVGNNYLSQDSATSTRLKFVNKTTAESSKLALWKATVSSNLIKLTNVQTGQSLNYYSQRNNFSNTYTRYFNIVNTSTNSNQNLTQHILENDAGVKLSYNSEYYMGATISNGYLSATSEANAMIIVPVEKLDTANFNGYGYRITNTPLAESTSLKVTKNWEHPFGDDNSIYENQKVTFKLYRTLQGVDAEPEDTGKTVTVDRYCNWTAEFKGLPYADVFGRPYVYTVVESWDNEDWEPVYGDVTLADGTTNVYTTTVTNEFTWANSIELPSTGGIGLPIFILIGLTLMAAPFVYGFRMRRRYRKGARR